MNVLFVCSADFRAPSEKQVLWFSRQLIERGDRVMVSLGDDPSSARSEAADEVPGLQLQWREFAGPRLRRRQLAAARAFMPDVVHAYNTRAPVVAAARSYARATRAPIFLHWEDDEWGLQKGLPTSSWPRRAVRSARRAGATAYPPLWYMSTRSSLSWAIENAVAFDAVAPTLAERVEARTGRPCALILPTMAPLEDDGPPVKLPARLAGRPLLTYTGHIHTARLGDIRLAMEATAEVQRRGQDVAFVQAGDNFSGVPAERLADESGLAPGSAAFLGHVPFPSIPSLLRASAILLSSSLPSHYNRMGLPSKLQSYLASGTPTIVSAQGAGELFEDRTEVLKTHSGEPVELADRIVELLQDGQLRQTLATGGPAAARRLFDPADNTETLIAHYRNSLDGNDRRRD